MKPILKLFDTLSFFLLPKVKRSVIIKSKYNMYELLRELLKESKLRILGNEVVSGKSLSSMEL